MQQIGDILKKMAKSRIATPTSESCYGSEPSQPAKREPDPPKVCCCEGKGWLFYDVPLEHPWFGQAWPCICKIMESRGRRREWLRQVCGLSLELLQKTLGTFNRPAQPEAFQAAALFVSGDAPQPWLLLQGGTGTGKTHLAAACVNGLVAEGVNAVYAYVPDMLDQLRDGYDDGSFSEQWTFLRTCQVLVLDEIREHQTPWVQEKLTSLVDYRLREMAPTMVSMNLSLREMPDPRIRSRLSDASMCRMVLMQTGDYRLRTGERRAGQPF